MIRTTEFIRQSIDNRRTSAVLFADMSKAFDSIWLILKLQKMGIELLDSLSLPRVSVDIFPGSIPEDARLLQEGGKKNFP